MKPPWQVWAFLFLALWSGYKAWELPSCPEPDDTGQQPPGVACVKLYRYVAKTLECAARSRERCCSFVQTLINHDCHCTRALSHGPRHQDLQGMWRACGGPSDIRLMVGILSAAKNSDVRMAVRETWAADDRLYRVLFFMARPWDEDLLEAVRQEEEWYGDVVLVPSIWEHYHNITHQTLEILRFAAAEPAATHVMKVDDDSYVRVSSLLAALEEAPRSRLLMGSIENPGGGPHRDPSSQWYVTLEEWPSEKYPPWAHGAGYVISQDLARQVAGGAALQVGGSSLFKLEDVAVGSWLDHVAQTRGLSLNLVHDPRFSYLPGCRSRDVVMHYISSADMRCIHQRGGQCCSRSQSGPFTVTEVQVPGEEVEGSGTTQGAAQRRRRRRVRDSKPSAEGEASALAAGT